MQRFKKHLEEKLKASDDMGTWVKDFQDSDAPQFKGKSQKKRQQMAVAAKLSAERNEEVELDEAAPKLKGDWLKKEREKNREHDAAMGRTPTGRKKPVRQMTSTQRSLASMRKEEVELDEVLDTPKAMDSYKNKAKYSKDRAANSAAAKMLRNKNNFHSTDTSQELKTMDKRTKGLKMADKNAMKKTFKALRGEEVELDEQTQYDLVEAYLLENNIDVDALSVEQLDEIIGKVVGGAFKVGAKAAVGAARLAKKAVVNKQGNVRGTAAAKNDAMKAKLDKLRKQRAVEVQRQKLKKDVERAQSKLAATKSRAK